MPVAALKTCSYYGCKKLVRTRYCAEHNRLKNKQYAASTGKHLYNSKWQKARRVFLIQNPLCIKCYANGVIEPATEVDHIIAHRQDIGLFWDQGNWQALCKSCHSRKTALEDGGFGRGRGG